MSLTKEAINVQDEFWREACEELPEPEFSGPETQYDAFGTIETDFSGDAPNPEAVTIHEMPKRIKSLTDLIHEMSETEAEAKLRVKKIELQTALRVSSAATTDGKKLHSNDIQRQVAVDAILAQNAGYQSDILNLAKLEALKAESQSELEMLRMTFRLALIDYEFQTLGRRAA